MKLLSLQKKLTRWTLAIFLSLYTFIILGIWFMSKTNTPERMERLSKRNPELIEKVEKLDPDKHGNGYIAIIMIIITAASYRWLYLGYKPNTEDQTE